MKHRAGIYILRNLTSGKCYIGKDLTLPKRALKHLDGKEPDCPAIHNAIVSQGTENFDVTLIDLPHADNKLLSLYEQAYIRLFRSQKPSGYNLTPGGDGGSFTVHTEEAKRKISEGQLGEKNHFHGKKHTAESRRKMSKSVRRYYANNKGHQKSGDDNPASKNRYRKTKEYRALQQSLPF